MTFHSTFAHLADPDSVSQQILWYNKKLLVSYIQQVLNLTTRCSSKSYIMMVTLLMATAIHVTPQTGSCRNKEMFALSITTCLSQHAAMWQLNSWPSFISQVVATSTSLSQTMLKAIRVRKRSVALPKIWVTIEELESSFVITRYAVFDLTISEQ